VKAQAAGRFGDATVKSVNAEQVEIARLKAQLAQVKMERDILKKRRRISLRSRCEVRLHRATQNCLADRHAMPRAEGQRQRLQSVPGAPEKGRR
jgi:transposase-like protein